MIGDCRGKRVVALGCGDGLNPVALASFGAKVFALDRSCDNLKLTDERARAHGLEEKIALVHHDAARIPVDASSIDRVFCAAPMNSADCISLGRQIRRILKPGGAGIFIQLITRSGWFGMLSRYVLRPESLIDHHFPLTIERAHSVSRAVGYSGRLREFKLTSRVLEKMGVQSFSTMLVWEARKEK